MKKIVPFKKDIIFKSNLSEITSISLEHSLHHESKHLITGDFIISGEYRMNENSINTESFSFDIPFDINMDEKYILDKVIIDINDFYYEIVNNKILSVNIEVLIDRLEEQPLIIEEEVELIDEPIVEYNLEDVRLETENIIEKEIKMEEKTIQKEEKKIDYSKLNNTDERCIEEEEVKSLFDNITNEEEYTSYKICIVREGDSLESIMMKYSISKEQMELYNDLNEIKIGDKLIIPSVKS